MPNQIYGIFLSQKTEMNDEERINRNDDRTDATIDFINWIKEKKINASVKNHVLLKK